MKKKSLKLLSVKRILIIGLIAVIIALIYFGIGGGFGTKDNGSESGNSSVSDEDSVEKEGKICNVTISENDYFYKNESISLGELVKELDDEEGDIIVEIKDENASLRAYNNLIEKLEEMEIGYTER